MTTTIDIPTTGQTFIDLDIGDLTLDPRVNRHVDRKQVNTIATNLNMDAIGVITVSARDNGTYVVLDGQHRVEALKQAGHEHHKVHCHVHYGLTLAQESALFRLLNHTRKVGIVDDYLKGVVAGDPECLDIDRIATLNGLTVTGTGHARHTIAAIAALRAVHRRKDGPQLLADTLQLLTLTWHGDKSAYEAPLIRGMAAFLATNPDIDKTVLIRKLAKEGGPSTIIGRARELVNVNVVRNVTGGVHYAIRDIYNIRRHTGRAE